MDNRNDKKAPRGIRNNNPGNIVRYKDAWKGMSDNQTDERFVVFTDASFGIRAMAVILRNYKKLHGIKTVADVIGRWAPASENDTKAYTDNIITHTGLDGEINLDNPAILYLLIKAIIKYENGIFGYKSDFMVDSIRMAFEQDEEAPRLPGVPLFFSSIHSCGSSENWFGVGDLDISASRIGSKYRYIDIGRINYSNPTEKQLQDAAAIPFYQQGGDNHSKINRTFSRKQAELVKDVIAHALMETFKGEFPADDEIAEWRKANGY